MEPWLKGVSLALPGISCGLPFEPGIDVLYGLNGVGKSRILEGIHAALGGDGTYGEEWDVFEGAGWTGGAYRLHAYVDYHEDDSSSDPTWPTAFTYLGGGADFLGSGGFGSLQLENTDLTEFEIALGGAAWERLVFLTEVYARLPAPEAEAAALLRSC